MSLKQDKLYAHLSSSKFFSLSRAAFSCQNFSDLCTGLHSSRPDFTSDEYSSNELYRQQQWNYRDYVGF